MSRKVLLPLACFASSLVCTAQYPTNADALRELIRSAPHDTTRAQAMLFLAVLLHEAQPDTVLPLCAASTRIADEKLGTGIGGVVLKPKEKKAYRRIKATALLNMGHYHHEHGQPETAMQQYDLANRRFEQAGFSRGASDAMLAMGALLKEQGNLDGGDLMIKRAAQQYEHAPTVAYGCTGYQPLVLKAGEPVDTHHKPEPSLRDTTVSREIAANAALTPPKDEHAEPVVNAVSEPGMALSTVDSVAAIEPSIQDSSTGTVNSNVSLARLGIDTTIIARYRERLSAPVREDGGALEARDNLERGEALEFIRESDRAMSSFQRSLNVYRILRSDSGECAVLLRIGKLQGERGEYEMAFTVLDSARLKARAMGRDDLEGLALAGMGDMCRRIEECGRAADLYKLSIELAHATGDRHTEARGYLGITEALVEKGSLKQAEPVGRKGLDIATDIDDDDLRQRGAQVLRDVYSGLGRPLAVRQMEELEQLITARIAEQDRAMDSVITAIRSDFDKKHELDSLEHQEVRTALETNLVGEQSKAKKNRTAALIIAICALVGIIGGTVYYRFDRRRRQARADRHAAELEIKALRAQMNPHFLFNALNSIHDHILEHDPEEAADYLTRFSKLMRQVLEMSRLNEVPLHRELEVLEKYIDIERLRLHGKFELSVEVAPGVDQERITIPPMLLQPFVENAIWHGLSRKEGSGHLHIAICRSGAALHIAIEDDGVGRPAEGKSARDHRSLGTIITKERLDLWAAQRGAPASFSYVSRPVGTRVELVLPWVEV